MNCYLVYLPGGSDSLESNFGPHHYELEKNQLWAVATNANTCADVSKLAGIGAGAPGERLARIEARLDSIEKHGATKTDIERLRGWILGGVIAAFVIALGIGYLAPPDRSPPQTAPQHRSGNP